MRQEKQGLSYSAGGALSAPSMGDYYIDDRMHVLSDYGL